MKLSVFIQQNLESILQNWEDFARSIQPAHRVMDVIELRDHAEEMLREIAEDLERPQSDFEKLEKSKGRGPVRAGDSAAEIHATLRLRSGFTIDQLVAEYRALRTSVLHLWSSHYETDGSPDAEDIIRFNEAVDQALSESVSRYSEMVRQAQDIFIAILGHDIRTPLNAIRIGAEILMRTETMEGKSIQLASRIFNSSTRISGLVDDLLDFTQARFGMQLSLRPVNIGLLAEQVIEEIRPAYPDRMITLSVSGELNGTWDSGRISQVISNLVCNALQHGSSTHPVSVVLNGEAGQVVLSVHNFGTPIPEGELGHIFEPLRRYYVASDDMQNARSNLGLGLYIAREVVVGHGGTISVESNQAKGTTFTVHLPKTKA